MEQLSPCSKFGCGDPQCDLCYKVDPSKCDMCGEPYDQDDPRPSQNEIGEFYDPMLPFDSPSYVGHVQCGIDRNYELC